MSYFLRVALGVLGLASISFGQHVISAKAGLVHHTQGKVFVDDKAVQPKIGEFVEMKPGDMLRTEDGLAEVLLTPGVFLRLKENSSFRLDANKLEDIRLELLSGSVLIEAGEVTKFDSIVLTTKGASINFPKRGLFRVESDPPTLSVIDGEAMVTADGETLKVKEGKKTALEGQLAAVKFDKEAGDAFTRWAGRRAGYLAAANVSSAKTILDSNMGWRSSGWYFNPYFGYFTFVPAFGNYYSPFGYYYYTPRRVDAIYNPPSYNAGGGGNNSGWSGGGGRSSFPDASSSGPSYSGSRGGYSSAPSSGGAAGGGAPAGGATSSSSGTSRGR